MVVERFEDLPIPGRKTSDVNSVLTNSVGFAASQAGAHFHLKNGETALYWHLISVIESHIDWSKSKPHGEE